MTRFELRNDSFLFAVELVVEWSPVLGLLQVVGKRSLISGMSRIERPWNPLLPKPLFGELF